MGRRDVPRRDQRDPAHHHRRARPRLAPRGARGEAGAGESRLGLSPQPVFLKRAALNLDNINKTIGKFVDAAVEAPAKKLVDALW
jgi:hypothetical protein